MPGHSSDGNSGKFIDPKEFARNQRQTLNELLLLTGVKDYRKHANIIFNSGQPTHCVHAVMWAARLLTALKKKPEILNGEKTIDALIGFLVGLQHEIELVASEERGVKEGHAHPNDIDDIQATGQRLVEEIEARLETMGLPIPTSVAKRRLNAFILSLYISGALDYLRALKTI